MASYCEQLTEEGMEIVLAMRKKGYGPSHTLAVLTSAIAVVAMLTKRSDLLEMSLSEIAGLAIYGGTAGDEKIQ